MSKYAILCLMLVGLAVPVYGFPEPKPAWATQPIGVVEALRAENAQLKEKLDAIQIRVKFLENLSNAVEIENRKLERANGVLTAERNRLEQQVEVLQAVILNFIKDNKPAGGQ